MAKHKDKRQPAERIAAQLRYEILSGELAPGTRLTAVQKLAEQHGVANSTMQRALSILKDEDLLVGRPGVSVTVRQQEIQTISPAEYLRPSGPGEPYQWITRARQRGQTGGNRLLDVGEVTAPRRVALALGLPEGETVVARSRVGLLDDEPAEYSISYYARAVARGTALERARLIQGGSPTLLAEMGLPIQWQQTYLTSRIATTLEYEALELPGNPPVLEALCINYTDGDRPVEVTVLVKPGHLYQMGFTVPAS